MSPASRRTSFRSTESIAWRRRSGSAAPESTAQLWAIESIRHSVLAAAAAPEQSAVAVVVQARAVLRAGGEVVVRVLLRRDRPAFDESRRPLEDRDVPGDLDIPGHRLGEPEEVVGAVGAHPP